MDEEYKQINKDKEEHNLLKVGKNLVRILDVAFVPSSGYRAVRKALKNWKPSSCSPAEMQYGPANKVADSIIGYGAITVFELGRLMIYASIGANFYRTFIQ